MLVIERSANINLIRELIVEYAGATGVDLSFQNFAEEISALDAHYEAIFLARWDGAPAGCVALRRIDRETCEMKRLYVRPQFRGKKIGQALAEHVIGEARARGYARMRLDTLPAMREAIALYRSLGFVEIAPYRFNPVEGSKYMELKIQD
jgi:ribosomal protein S18 acetylase RimI-like enzyme